jgi:hypothetical protein
MCIREYLEVSGSLAAVVVFDRPGQWGHEYEATAEQQLLLSPPWVQCGRVKLVKQRYDDDVKTAAVGLVVLCLDKCHDNF